ncbi:hypothetical protein Xmau_00351 [Xenorhabdus mauleonii]|uniref:Uncharacterized protein n=1 Tax=Xenorhabdus mauleonii TaxID=351675 RepID=A0A1I3U7S6_9GAMM|nr:hypothetical protein Xmau_00351 [Xenorhabdus mauleonii]SFJ79628.1 hypothetical protein SAMN05421680_11666 [Xenorhabdus mauleonii]
MSYWLPMASCLLQNRQPHGYRLYRGAYLPASLDFIQIQHSIYWGIL